MVWRGARLPRFEGHRQQAVDLFERLVSERPYGPIQKSQRRRTNDNPSGSWRPLGRLGANQSMEEFERAFKKIVPERQAKK
jgi:hypothetical protein